MTHPSSASDGIEGDGVPASRPALLALVVKLEAATEGSRELDACIDAAIHGRTIERIEPRAFLMHEGRYDYFDERRRPLFADPPNYTSSLDAALTLLPSPGHPLWTAKLHVVSHGSHGLTWDAEVTVPSREFQGWSRTPNGAALALCIAALRARASRKSDQAKS